YSIALGAQNSINDTNWHHVAVVGDGEKVRFYVDGQQDGAETTLNVFSTGASTHDALIGAARGNSGSLLNWLSGSVDNLQVYDRRLNGQEINQLASGQTPEEIDATNSPRLATASRGLAHYDYGFRIYNPSLGRFLSVDPLTKSYPMLTPYQFASNMPIAAIDLDGQEAKVIIYSEEQFADIKKAYKKGDIQEVRRIVSYSLHNQFVKSRQPGDVDYSSYAQRKFEKKWGKDHLSETDKFPKNFRPSKIEFDFADFLNDVQIDISGLNYETGEIERVGLITGKELRREIIDEHVSRVNEETIRVDRPGTGGTGKGDILDYGNLNPEEGTGTAPAPSWIERMFEDDGLTHRGPGDTTWYFGVKSYDSADYRVKIDHGDDKKRTIEKKKNVFGF
ncbi:MAG: LamG-like jellyroll fold domain-containing protein, partial [Cyanobacteria bacterium J06639_18]